MSSSFTEKLAGQDVRDHHLFVTSHPYMIELGLGTFTTGTLYNWWNDSNSEGLFLNRMSINPTRAKNDLGSPAKDLDTLLGIKGSTEFFWYGWKPHQEFQNAGRYKRQNLSGFRGNSGGSGSDSWTFDGAVGPVTGHDVLYDDFGNPYTPVIGGTLASDGVTFTKIVGKPNRLSLARLDPLYSVINLNRYMTAFSDFYPRSLWDKDDPDIGGQNTKEVFAAHELLTDIKSSKLGPYIEWSGEVSFYISELNCPITEWVPFKLYLFDNSNSSSENKTLTVKNLTHVAPKRDVTGRTFGTQTDGGLTEYDSSNPASRGAAPIDLSYNTVTKKWEGGTPQLFAKLTTDIAAAVSSPTIERLESNDVAEDLDGDVVQDVLFVPATGLAMPIRPQNGNPLQWQPNYVDSEDVRCAAKDPSKEKEKLVVYNYNSKRGYKRDEEVFLARIEGQWQVAPLWPDPVLDDGDLVTSEVGKWGEFTYMATNCQFLFRTIYGAKFSPKDAEFSFHKEYYAGDFLNSRGSLGVDYGLDGGYDKFQTFNTMNTVPIEIDHGYWQITSFDHLDSKLYGIRSRDTNGQLDPNTADKCSIATTSATHNAAGSIIPGPASYTSRNAAHAGTFFGCIFPAGYGNVDRYFANRDWSVQGKSTGSQTDPMVNPNTYFNTLSTSVSDKPFEAVDPTAERNNCRQQALNEPMSELEDGNNSWSRHDSRASASLFAEYAKNKLNTFQQMPADVMLNASPRGEFGSPLYPVHRFAEFHASNSDKALSAAQAFLQGSYLGKNGGAGGTPYSDTASAFDFPPVSRNNLMFRPLKMEGYIQFGEKINNPSALSTVTDLSPETIRDSRTAFSVEAHRTQLDDRRPCSMYVDTREEAQQAVSPGNPPFFGDYGLAWGGDVTGKSSYQNLHDQLYWNPTLGPMKWQRQQQWLAGPGNWRGAGAYGVITTFNTVSATSQIDFTTDNLYGMGAASVGKPSLERGSPKQNRTWGVNTFRDSYSQENIIDLSVRIFQQHPRDQLLYDPRTFAVHHFNPDVRYKGDVFVQDNGIPTGLSPVRNSGVEEGIKGKNQNNAPILYKYNYPLPSSEVDIQEVCRFQKHTDQTVTGGVGIHEENKTYDAIPLVDGNFIFANACYDGTWLPPVIKQKFWKINTTRVGKLLPYRYYQREVGVPIAENAPLDLSYDNQFVKLKSQLSNTPALDIYTKMILRSPGSGYSVGDTVGIANNDVSFRVSEIGVNPRGRIIKLTCVSRGTGITAAQCASSGDLFNPNSANTSLALKTLSGAGEGLDAYFVASQVYGKMKTDPKPYLIKRDGQEIVRIAADVPQGTHKTDGFTAQAEAAAFVDESRQVTFMLDPTIKSKNSQYDVFFHFHNDISMTWLAGGDNQGKLFHGDAYNRTECSEQHVTVRINPR